MSDAPARQPLTPDERDLLADVARFNRAAGAGGYRLRDRVIDVGLPGLHLVGAALDNLDLSGADLSGAVIEGCSFADCDLSGVDLSGARVGATEFVRCEFGGLRARAAAFDGCAFRQSRLNKAAFPEARMTGCAFDGTAIDGTRFERAALTDVAFAGGTVSGVTFADSDLRGVRFRDARVEFVLFLRSSSHDLAFAGGSLANVGVDRGVHLGMAIEAAAVESVTFQSTEADGVTLARCESVGSVALLVADVKRLRVVDCARVADLTATESRLAGLELRGGEFGAVLLADCDVTDARASNLGVATLALPQSRVTNLALDGVTVAEALIAADAVFVRLSVARAVLAKGATLEAEGATFDAASDRLPGP